jgi:hypothetical protein
VAFDEDLAQAYRFDIETLQSDKDFWTNAVLLYFEQAFEAFVKASQSHNQASTPQLITSVPPVVTLPPNPSTPLEISPVPSEATGIANASASSYSDIFDY